jgi:hypothetical protein
MLNAHSFPTPLPHPLSHSCDVPGALIEVRITQHPRLLFGSRKRLPLIGLHYGRSEVTALAGLRPPSPNFHLKKIAQISTPRIGRRSCSLDRINSLSDRPLRIG